MLQKKTYFKIEFFWMRVFIINRAKSRTAISSEKLCCNFSVDDFNLSTIIFFFFVSLNSNFSGVKFIYYLLAKCLN